MKSVLSSLQLLTLAWSAPKFSQNGEKYGKYFIQQVPQNQNSLPVDQPIPIWNNPWILNQDPPVPQFDILNFGDRFSPMGKRGGLPTSNPAENVFDDNEPEMEKRSLMKMFRLFKKSVDANKVKQVKRNMVPMLG